MPRDHLLVEGEAVDQYGIRQYYKTTDFKIIQISIIKLKITNTGGVLGFWGFGVLRGLS